MEAKKSEYPWKPKNKGEPGFYTAQSSRKKTIKRDWIVKDIILNNTVSMLVGQAESYKSFLISDLLFCISHGIDFFGNKTKKQPVAMIVAEGGYDIPFRMEAMAQKYQVPEIKDFYVCEIPIDLALEDTAKEFKKIIDSLPKEIGMLCVDTLATCNASGDENSSASMSKFINNLNLLGNFSKIIVHHAGYGKERRARGSSALIGAVDCSMFLQRNESTDLITLSCTKMKAAQHFKSKVFSPEIINVFGNETSIVLNQVCVESSITQKKKKPKEKILDFIAENTASEEDLKERFSLFGYASPQSVKTTITRMKKAGEIIEKDGAFSVLNTANNIFKKKPKFL